VTGFGTHVLYPNFMQKENKPQEHIYAIPYLKDKGNIKLAEIFKISKELSGYTSSMYRNPAKYGHKYNFLSFRKFTIYFAFLFADCTVNSLAEYLETNNTDILEILEDDKSRNDHHDFISVQNEFITHLLRYRYYTFQNGELCINPLYPKFQDAFYVSSYNRTSDDKWQLFLDDIRQPSSDDFTQAYTMGDAVKLIQKYGMPSYISFDHDLGSDSVTGELLPTGYDLAKWIVENDQNGTVQIPESFRFTVHSNNPIDAENIRSLLSSYLKSKDSNKE